MSVPLSRSFLALHKTWWWITWQLPSSARTLRRRLRSTGKLSSLSAKGIGKIGKMGKMGKMGTIGKIGKIGKMGNTDKTGKTVGMCFVTRPEM
jgi:hypothetical protein